MSQYAIRRINGAKSPEVELALDALRQMTTAALGLIKHLDWHDFETLVDLVFSTSGWRRLGKVGGSQKTIDLDLTLPSTGERAFVQIKARTNSAELTRYVERLEELEHYNRMFYVFHSGSASTEDDRVTVVDPKKLAEMVIEAGLVNWLIRKAS